ncbi:CBS domain-containing protein [bacterium]|nr:CBS domain-containing protein [bacterium]
MNVKLVQSEVSVLNPKLPVCLPPTTPMSEIIQTFQTKKPGCVLITNDGQLAGIITERDIVTKFVHQKKNMKTMVRELMTPNPEYLFEDDSIAFALNRMSVIGSRNIAVLDKHGIPTGVITIEEILQFIASALAIGK